MQNSWSPSMNQLFELSLPPTPCLNSLSFSELPPVCICLLPLSSVASCLNSLSFGQPLSAATGLRYLFPQLSHSLNFEHLYFSLSKLFFGLPFGLPFSETAKVFLEPTPLLSAPRFFKQKPPSTKNTRRPFGPYQTVAACPEMPQALAAKAEGAERCLRLAVEGTEIFCPSKRVPQIGGENHGRWPFLW